ncbi:glycosyltransferase [Massilia aurea]|uniref:glycosyltransferase n=1 Tax=Massilia aurea TaxID=373040 RepID=UPI003461B728
MRIVIDLLGHADHVDAPALTLAAALARAAGELDVWVAAPLHDTAALELLRLEPALGARVRAFDLPAGPAHALLRRHAIAGLAPAAVLAMGLQETDAPYPVLAHAAGDDTPDAAALLTRLAALGAAAQRPLPAAAARPRLAYVSPLPPTHSGIADYSAELVPELARFYDVELVVAQATMDDRRLNKMPLRDPAWLRAHAHEFERVVYHFGNSHAHQHMFELVRDVPGIVVLHDFFFSGVLDNLEREEYLPKGFLHALYESHGYSGLLSHRKDGRNPSIWTYPLNKGVLDAANGVIVHSDFSRELATEWYGPGAADGWRTIPLLRGRPDGSTTDAARSAARQAARQRLGLADDEFVVCTFGMLGSTKLNAELLDAYLASPLGADAQCRLVFVGANDPGPYGQDLEQAIAASVAAERIRITGFVDAGAYADWLAACDGAVQLRSSTRGETSASVLDCLLYGAPTIVNAHGSTAALPDELLIKLDDRFAIAELAASLASLRSDRSLRDGLSTRALAFMAAHHAPAQVGRQYAEAIEQFAANGRAAIYRRLVDQAAPLVPERALPALAEAIAFNRAPTPQRQLLVDVSALMQSDLRTGIQRVVRSILRSMIANPPPGLRIEPVYSHGGNRPYIYARNFGMKVVDETELVLEDAPADIRPGDIFFGLDLFTNGTSQNEALLLDMRMRGVEVYFVVYDVLPMLRPEVFPFGTEQYFGDFLRTVHKVADGVLCISRAVADELAGWIASQRLERVTPFKLAHFHLGADIDASAPSFGLPPDADHVLTELALRPSFIMVGTVEPRKGHAQALAAFELLWEAGVDVNLVVVGKQGWMVDKVCERMAAHPEKSKRLFWLPGISDEMLQKLYAGSSALLAASEGEGFGLPLIEAAQHGIPILARSLPVFREVAGEHAVYFDGLAASDLADAIGGWLALHRDGKAPPSTGMPWLTWDGSAQQALDALVRQRWYQTLPGSKPVVNTAVNT